MAYPTMWLVIFFTTAAAIQLDWDTAATSDLSGEASQPKEEPKLGSIASQILGAIDNQITKVETKTNSTFKLDGDSQWSSQAGDCSFCVNRWTGEPDGCFNPPMYSGRCVNADYSAYCIPAGTVYTNPVTSCEAPEAPTTTERASAVGDPHLSNMAGEHFDIYQPGTFTLLQVPRRPGAPGATLLRVEADARRMGDVCSLYFQAVNISGTWTNQSKPIIFVANARGFPDGMKYNQWMHFGPVDLKVKYRKKGVEFLNIYANSVGRTGYAVGGLLGSDDHTAVSIRPRQCSHSARRAMLASSVAETQW